MTPSRFVTALLVSCNMHRSTLMGVLQPQRMTASHPSQKVEQRQMPAQHAMLAVRDQGIENIGARKKLPGVLLDPQPGTHFKRQKNTFRIFASLQVQVIPQIAMGKILDALRLKDILVMAVRLQVDILERMHFSKMLDRLSCMCVGKPYPVANAKSGMTIQRNAELAHQQL